jgi:hypothetical protein
MLHIPLFVFYCLPRVSFPLEPSSGRHTREHVIELNERRTVADSNTQIVADSTLQIVADSTIQK